MEKGKLIIRKTKSGFETLLQYEKGGAIKSMPLSFVRLKSDEHNDKDCRYRRDQKGQIVHIELMDGTLVYSPNPVAAAPQGGQSSRNAVLDAQVPDIFNLANTCVPQDVRNLAFWDIDNFHLKLNRFAYLKKEEQEQPLDWGDKRKKFMLCETARQKGFVRKIRPEFGAFASPKLLAQVVERQHKAALTLCQTDANLFAMNAAPKWKLALGLGNESVYETAMTLHHIYGLPYIPASAVKGILRTYYIRERCENKELKAIQDPFFCQIFGCPDQIKVDGKSHDSCFKEAREGKAIFFDAFPLTAPTVEPDIMNPHYSEYYTASEQGEHIKAPTDTGSPIPIHFLVVKDTTFRFWAGIKPSPFTLEEKQEGLDKDIIKFIKENLPIALSEHGLGAKTAVGYGYFKETR